MKKEDEIIYKTSEGYKNRIETNKIALWFVFAFISMIIAIFTKLLVDNKISTPLAYIALGFMVALFVWFGFKILELTFELIRKYDNLKYEEMEESN